MNQTTLLFLCLARDSARDLPEFSAYLWRLHQRGFKCHAIVGENGSHDNSRNLIKKSLNITLIDTSFMESSRNRFERMARGREALLVAARELAVDYTIVADLDAFASPPHPDGIEAAIRRLQNDTSLFAVGTTSKPVYYDLLSLKAPPRYDPSGWIAETRQAQRNPFTYYAWMKRRVYAARRAVQIPAEGLRVDSSFNGFVIYNAEDYRRGSYRARDETKVCEHVNFHQSIARQTSRHMIIGPELVIRTPDDHAPVGFWRFWRDRLIRKLRP
jgi:hypothetical protein